MFTPAHVTNQMLQLKRFFSASVVIKLQTHYLDTGNSLLQQIHRHYDSRRWDWQRAL